MAVDVYKELKSLLTPSELNLTKPLYFSVHLSFKTLNMPTFWY